jgi:hypothetical protein
MDTTTLVILIIVVIILAVETRRGAVGGEVPGEREVSARSAATGAAQHVLSGG